MVFNTVFAFYHSKGETLLGFLLNTEQHFVCWLDCC